MSNARQIVWFLYHYPEAANEAVLDVGCGKAASLASFGPGSVGLDGDDRYIVPLQNGKKVLKWVFDQDIRSTMESYGERGQFKYVCCLNSLEHVMAPHLHLLNLRRCVQDDGYLYLSIPLARTRLHHLLRALSPSRLSRYWKGYLQSDHVNFWTPQTFDLTVTYAGFEIVRRYYGGVPKAMSRYRWLNGLLGEGSPTYGVVCRKIPGWNYKKKDSVWKTLTPDGYVQWVSRIES